MVRQPGLDPRCQLTFGWGCGSAKAEQRAELKMQILHRTRDFRNEFTDDPT
jgi:hypothetical protein